MSFSRRSSVQECNDPMLGVQEQRLPRLLALAVAVGDRNQLLLAVGGRSHQDQDALAIFFQANVEVDPVGPQIDALLPFQGASGPLLKLVFPDLLQPRDRRGGESVRVGTDQRRERFSAEPRNRWKFSRTGLAPTGANPVLPPICSLLPRGLHL